MMTLDERASKLAELIEEYANDTSEPAVTRGMILRTHCDAIALDELLSMLAMTEEEA